MRFIRPRQPDETTNRAARNLWQLRLIVCLALSQLLILVAVRSSAQQPVIDREAKIKAAYLYQFIRYVQWPDATADPSTPIVIGTVGGAAVDHYVALIARNRRAGNRELMHLQVTTAEQARRCNILFVPESTDPESASAIIQNLREDPVLLVGETRQFVESGGVIAFSVVDNNVRLQLSMKSAAERNLKISSQLAKLAQLIN